MGCAAGRRSGDPWAAAERRSGASAAAGLRRGRAPNATDFHISGLAQPSPRYVASLRHEPKKRLIKTKNAQQLR